MQDFPAADVVQEVKGHLPKTRVFDVNVLKEQLCETSRLQYGQLSVHGLLHRSSFVASESLLLGREHWEALVCLRAFLAHSPYMMISIYLMLTFYYVVFQNLHVSLVLDFCIRVGFSFLATSPMLPQHFSSTFTETNQFDKFSQRKKSLFLKLLCKQLAFLGLVGVINMVTV